MFYKYNQTTQSSAATGQEMSLNVKASEPAQIQYEYSTPLSRTVVEAMKEKVKNGYPVPNTPRYRKLMQMQSKFSLADGKLVWQKLPKDMPIYYAIISLVTVGLGLTMFSLKKLATPPKN